MSSFFDRVNQAAESAASAAVTRLMQSRQLQTDGKLVVSGQVTSLNTGDGTQGSTDGNTVTLVSGLQVQAYNGFRAVRKGDSVSVVGTRTFS